MDYQKLIKSAFEAREMSYSPYSGFKVGAALLATNGDIIKGCNIESASYSPTNCAERTAFFKAVSEGITSFSAIAVVGGHKDTPIENLGYAAPCGVCRQVMREFCDDNFEIIIAKSQNEFEVVKLSDLLPFSFGPENLA